MQQQVKCTKCNADNESGLNFCIYCGCRLSSPCSNCGALVPPDSRFCPSCAALTGMGRFGKHQHKVESTPFMLKCSHCGAENESGRRFCSQCGSIMAIPCPSCGNTNVLPSGYCPDCGHIGPTGDK